MRKRSTNYKRRPAYVKKTTIAGPTITIDKYISGRIGTKDQHRVRIHPTEEKVMRWQNKRAERKVYGLLRRTSIPMTCGAPSPMLQRRKNQRRR